MPNRRFTALHPDGNVIVRMRFKAFDSQCVAKMEWTPPALLRTLDLAQSSEKDRDMSDIQHGKRPTRASRRWFLKYAGMAAASAVAFGVDVRSLKLGEAFAQMGPVDVGAGDIGILNYAYALEQLEAAFYTQVLAQPYGGMSGYEREVLRDIRAHEVAHVAFFAKALGRRRIPNLTPNFSMVNFADRASVLTTASTFEDLGVSAYNGGGAAIQNPAYLAAAGSIVSVEARHAAILRDIIRPLTSYFVGFDVVNFNGLDVSRAPSQVLPLAAPFIATPLSATQLP